MRPRGSIRAKEPNTWELRYSIKGHRYCTRVHGTLQQARKRLTAVLKEADDDNLTAPDRINLATILEAWLADGRATNKSDAWQRLNGDSMRHWQRHIGHVRLQELTALDVMRARDSLLAGDAPKNPHFSRTGASSGEAAGRRPHKRSALTKGQPRPPRPVVPLSPKTVSNDIGALRTALAWAQRLRYISRNVALDVEIPNVERRSVAALRLEHAEVLLAALWDWERSETNMLAVGLIIGVRTYSELGGQPKTALDLDQRTLELNQVLLGQVQNKRGRWGQKLVAAGNAKHHRRLLEIPERAVPFLERQVAWLNRVYADQGMAWNPNRLLFPNSEGLPMKHSTLHRVFKRALSLAGLENTNVHALRHTCASLALKSGASMKEVQAILGHSSYRLTADTYAHLEPGRVRNALNDVWAKSQKHPEAPGGLALETSILVG